MKFDKVLSNKYRSTTFECSFEEYVKLRTSSSRSDENDILDDDGAPMYKNVTIFHLNFVYRPDVQKELSFVLKETNLTVDEEHE